MYLFDHVPYYVNGCYKKPTIEEFKKWRGKEKLPIISDTMADCFLNNPNRKEYTSLLVSLCFDLDYNYVLKNIKYLNTRITRNKPIIKRQYLDVLVQIDDLIVNIEVNSKYSLESLLRNQDYLQKVYSNNLFIGDNYLFNKVYQISIDNFKFKDIDDSYEIYSNKNNNGLELFDNEKCLHIYLPNIKNKYYNNNERLTPLERYMLVLCEKTDIAKLIAKGDRIMEKYVEDAVTACNSEGVYMDFDYEKDAERVNRAIIRREKREAEDKAITKEKTSIAKKMIKDGIDIKQVSKYTGLSLDKIKTFL